MLFNIVKKVSRTFFSTLSIGVIALVACASALAVDAQPAVSITPPATQPFIGMNYSFTLNFSNASPSQAGFGPYVDLYMPVTGHDGIFPGTPAPANTYDGSDVVPGSINYLGAPLTVQSFTLNASNQFVHPYAKDSAGNPVTITAPAGFKQGDKVYVIQLPFGSFTPGQPTVPISVTANLSNLADVGTALPIAAVAGFRYGDDALDNPTKPDPTLISGPASSSISPTLLRLKKTYIGPEDETATGPNFPRQYVIDVVVAPGQTITNLAITDVLPTNMQFVRVDSVTGNTTVTVTPTATPVNASPSPGGTLTRTLDKVLGTGSHVNPVTNALSDAQMTFTFYIPEKNKAGASILLPTTGTFNTSLDTASSGGMWTPVDTRDTPIPQAVVSNTDTHTLNDKSLAIQKTVTDISHPGAPVPGDTLEYTLQFQVSDYFAFQNVFFKDVISDGQHFDGTFAPIMSVNANPYALGSAAININNYTVSQNWTGATLNTTPYSIDPAADDGTTAITFNVSNEIITRGQSGKLVGGLVPSGGGTIIPDAFPIPASQGDGPTTVTIVFRTVIQDKYTNNFPSGDPSLDPRDQVSDSVSATGDLLNNAVGLLPYAGPIKVTDTSAATVVIVPTTLVKSIYAINGVPGTYTNPNIAAGDVVTYRLEFSIPFGDVELLKLEDFLPLPVFSAGEVTAFDTLTPTAVPPPAGFARFKDTDTFFNQYMLAGPTFASGPVISSDMTANSLKFQYQSFDYGPNTPLKVDIIFSVTVSSNPFADGLFLTNQVQATEGTTNSVPTPQTQIVQIILTEPNLNIKKGVVSDNDTGKAATPTYSPATRGPVAFTDPTIIPTANPRFTGTINSTNLGTSPINSNMANAEGSDLVTFAIVVENTGTGLHGAFNVQIKDTLPAGFHIPTAGINLSVTDGTGTAIPFTNIGAGTGLLNQGIQLTDAGPIAGSLAPFDTTNGKNIAIITYDLQVDASTDNANSTLTNTATLINYTTSPTGPVFLLTPLSDPATVTISSPSLAKTLIGTSVTTTGNNAASQATIGEIVTYQLKLTVPQGTTPAAKIVDTLPAGMAYVGTTAITIDPGITTANPLTTASATITSAGGGTGNVITYNTGTITNTTTTDTGANHITITYLVVVLDVATNITGKTLTNSAQLSFTGSAAIAAVSAAAVTVVEPKLSATKTVLVNGVSAGPGDAGDPVVYTIVLKHTAASQTDAFDVTFTDTIPSDIAITGVLVTDSIGIIDSTNFQLSGQVITTTAGGFNFPYSTTRTITLTVNGTIKTTAFTGETISNTATVNWTSLSGNPGIVSVFNTSSTERTGANGPPPGTPVGSPDTYANSSTIAFQVFTPVPVKHIIATSQTTNASLPSVADVNHIAATNATIGEIVRFHLTSVIAEGTTANLVIQDVLPAGMQFVNDGTAKVAFVSNGNATAPGKITSTKPASATLALALGANAPTIIGTTPDVSPTFVLPDVNIGSDASVTANNDAYTPGGSVYFKLGDLTNTDSDSDSEYVVIEFNALVLNVAGNLATTPTKLDNTFNVIVSSGLPAQAIYPSGKATVTVIEPKLTIGKTVSPTTGNFDAGDVLTYTITITNTGNSPAYGMIVTDPVISPLTFFSLNATTVPGGTNVVLGSAPAVGGMGNVVVNIDTLAPTGIVVLTLKATTISTLSAQTIVPNTATVTYTSLPPVYGTTNATGSLTTSVANAGGSSTGWRDGSGSPALNNYSTSGSVSVTSNAPSVDKLNPSVSRATIGDPVTYDILVTLPEGVTKSLSVSDTVPPGMSLQSFTYITTAAASPLLSADFAGTLLIAGNPATMPTVVPALPASTGTAVSFTFGTVTVPATTGTTANKFVIRVVTRIDNVIGNQIKDSLYTAATTTFLNASALRYVNNAGTTVNLLDSDLTTPTKVTLREPVLNVAKTITTPASAKGDAGDVITYKVVISNPPLAVPADGANAFQVAFSDTLPSGILATSIVSEVAAGATVTTPVAINGGNTGLTGLYDIPINGTVTIMYTATVQDSAKAGATLNNAVNVKWNSQPSPSTAGRSGADGLLDTASTLNDYQLITNAPFTMNAPQIDKQNPSVGRATIGDLVTYDILVTLPEGTTQSLSVTDAIPAGMNIESFTVFTTTGGASPLTANFRGTLAGPTLTPALAATGTLKFDFGDTVVTGLAGTSGNQFVIRVSCRVLNVIGNQIQAPPTYPAVTTTFNNTAKLTYTPGGSATPTDVLDPFAPTAVTLREPVLSVAKSILTPASQTGDAGDVITYQVVITNPTLIALPDGADANQVAFTDTLPSGILATSIVSEAAAGGATVTTTATINGGNTGLTGLYFIPVGGSVTIKYTATVQNSARASEALSNLADVKWNSQPTTNPNGRSGVDGFLNDPTKPLNDYQVKSATTFTVTAPAIDKKDPSVSRATIGDSVTYDILVTVPEGTTNGLTVSDVIPPGMTLTGYQVITVPSGALTTTFTGSVTFTPGLSNALPTTGTETFTFGTVTVPGTSTDAGNQFLLRVTMRVLNIYANQIQGPNHGALTTTFYNTASLTYFLGATATPATVSDGTPPGPVTLTEPVLTVLKIIKTPATTPDAGGVVTYQVVINNPNNSDAANAYQVKFTDLMPAGLQVTSVTPDVAAGGASVDSTSVITGGGTGLSGMYTIPIGATVTVTYSATILNTAPAGGTLTNLADVKWNSQPSGTNGRDGSDGLLNTVGTLNDYDVQSSTSFMGGSPVIHKSNPSQPQATIGEIVTYDILVTLPEGLTQSVKVLENIPGYMALDHFDLDTTMAQSSLLGADFSGTFTTTPTNAGLPVSNATAGSSAYTFDFGNVNIPGTPGATRNQFVIRVYLRPLNDINNQIQAPPTYPATTPSYVNTANLTYIPGGSATPATINDGTTPNPVTLREPVLSIIKSIQTLPNPVDAGGVVTYQVVLSNPTITDGATANNAVLTDTVPTDLQVTSIVSETLAGGTTLITAAAITGGGTGLSGKYTIPMGGSVTVVYNALIRQSATPVEAMKNVADVQWTSLPGANTNGRSSSNDPTKLLNTSGVLNDYELQSTTTFNTVNGSIAKALAATSEPTTTGNNVTLGEVVTYNLTVTLPEGTTPTMTITDTLPSGLIFVTGSPVLNTTGFNGTVGAFTTTPATAVGGDLVIFTFANPITVTADNVTTNNSFVISFQARVRDIPANVGTAVGTQTNLTNSTATLKAGTAPTVNSPSGVTVTVVEPLLNIVKSFSPVSPAAPNDTITIKFVATNTGLSTAFEPIVTDILDARFTNITAATTPAGYTFGYNAGTNTVTYTAAPGIGIAPGVGAAVTFTFTAKIASTAVQGDVLVNSVTISNLTTLPGATNQTDERTEPPATGVANLAIVTPDMVVTKTDNSVAHTVVPGQLLTYTLTVQNVGPHDATGVVLHEIVPPNMTYVSGGSSAWVVPVAGTPLPDGSVSGTPAQINIGNVAAGAAPVAYSFVVRVNATVPSGITTIDNTTTVNDDGTHGSDPTPPNNTATDTVNVTAAPDLVITKTDNQGGSTTPGATVTYTLTVQNVGNQNATGAQVKETVPANTTYVAAGSSAWLVTGGGSALPNGSAAGTLAEIEIGNIAAGAPPLIFTFVVVNNATMPAGVTQTLNTATTNDDGTNGPDPTPANNTASDPIPITATPDMVVTKTDDAGGIVVPGQTVTYTLTVQNVGNQDATGVVLHETVPPNMTYVQAGSSAWQLTPPSGPLPNGAVAGTTSQITIGNAAAKAAATTYTYKAIVNATVPVGTTSITNTTTVNDDGTNGPDPTPPNNTATDTISLVAVPDLVVTKIDNSGGAFVPGQTYAYTITVKNVGKKDASGVVLHDIVPPNTTYVSGGSAWLDDTTNTALATGAVPGTAAHINIGLVTAGAPLTTYTLLVKVDSLIPAGINTIANTTTVNDDGANGADPSPGNNTATDIEPLNAAPDLVITKTDNSVGGIVVPGQTYTYTLTVQNVGNQNATGVQVKDTVPPNTTYVSAGSSPWIGVVSGTAVPTGAAAGTAAVINIGNMTAGAAAQTFTFVVMVNNPVASGVSSILNTATTNDDGTNGPDPTPLNNTANDTVTLNAAPDLVITKTDNSSGTVVPGQTFTYTMTVKNVGNQDATGVVIKDVIPPNTSYVLAGSSAWLATIGGATLPDGSIAGTQAQINIGALAAGSPALTFTLVVKVNATIPAGISSIANTATTNDDGTNGPDPTPLNNTATDTVNLNAAPDLVITKTDNSVAGIVIPGQTFTYTITVKNVGNQDATGGQVKDTVPPNTTYVAAGSSGWKDSTGTIALADGSVAGTAALINIGNIAAGAPATTYTLVVKVNNPVPAGVSSILNTATTNDDGTNGPDPTPANNTANDTVTVNAQPDLTIVKTDNSVGGIVAPGQTLTYTLVVKNVGNQDATGAQVKDVVPPNSTYVSAGSSPWLATVGGAALPNGAASGTQAQINIGTLAAGATQTFTFVVKINATVTAGSATFVNTATTNDDGSNGPDPTPSNNTSTVTDTLTGQPDLVIVKSDGGKSVIPGSTLVYTLSYTNVGPKGASNVTIHETVPPNTTYASAGSTAGWTFTNGAAAGTMGSINVGTVNPGDTGTVTFVIKLNASIPVGTVSVDNTATIDDDGTNGPDLNPPDNTSTISTHIPTADLLVKKTVDNAAPPQLSVVNYTITVTDLGPDGATGVVIGDTLPVGLTYISSTPSQGTYDNATGMWTVGSIANGASVTLTIQARVSVGTQGQNILNLARVITTTTYDPNPPNDTSTVTIVPLPCPIPTFISAPVASPSPAIQGQVVTFAVVASDNENHAETYVWDFGDGSTGTGPMPTHTYSAPGNYTIKVTATSDCGSTISTTIPLNIIPINCDPTKPATKNPPDITASATGSGMTWNFTAVATDKEDGTLTNVSWNFGDGTFGFGPTVSHTYTQQGVIFVTAMVTDSDGNCRETILEVNPRLGSGNPGDMAPASALSCTLLRVSASFKKTPIDALTLAVQLDVPAGFNAANQPVSIQVAGLQVNATLNAKGAYKDANHAIQVKHIGRGTVLTLKVSKAEFKKQFGVIVNATVGPEALKGIGLKVSLGTNVFAGNVDLTYKSKINVSATLVK